MKEDSQVRSLLEEVLNSGRTPEEVCASRPDLLQEVRTRLLRIQALSDELQRALPTQSPIGFNNLRQDTQLPEVPGYVLLELLGRGGMGVVYRARDLNFNRDVAVKLLQERHASDSRVARRFAGEARITAQLQHPAIPPVHELGTLPDGLPFLVMKLIKGGTLDQLLAARAIPADDRGQFVATFEQVCQAVGYAHAHHVIHRDLKPSNVMVGAFGEVQVMDWGLAKILSEPGSPQLASDRAPNGFLDTVTSTAIGVDGEYNQETRPCDMLGTPAFMPPEQAIGAIDQIDARSDVYCLGGILCAILTGKPPFVAATPEATRQLAAHAQLDDAHARLAACGAEPELVALCLRCLAPERDDRPRDAGEVAAAVAALRAAAEERAQRAELDRVRVTEQGKRRRVLLAAGGVILVVLLMGLSVSLWQTWRTGQALAGEQLARQDESKARQQAFDALRTMTADVVERKFAQETVLTDDDRTFLRSVIAQFDAFAGIKGDDADSRAVRAEGRLRVGTIRYRLGEFAEAEQDYNEAVRINRQLMSKFPSRTEFRQDLANSCNNRGHLLLTLGRPKEAKQDYDEALGIYRQLVAEFPTRFEFRKYLAGSLNNLGIMMSGMGRLAEAKKEYDEALNIRKQLVSDFPTKPELREDLATSHNNRGVLLRGARRLEEAERDYNEALSIRRQLAEEFPSRPEFRQQLATSYNNRGVLLRDAGRLKDAENDCDQSVSILVLLASEFPSRIEFRQQLATSHTSRGSLLYASGHFENAEKDCDKALDIRRQLATDFPDQPDLRNQLAVACLNRAAVHQQRSEWVAAKQLLLDGRPHHLAALNASPSNLTYRQGYRNNLMVLTAVYAALLEPEEAVRTAEICRDLGWDAPKNAYDAACFLSRCVPIVASHDKLDSEQREKAVKFYGDAAMKFLHDAVRKGLTAATQIREAPDLDPLRQRDDFQALVAELAGRKS